MPGVKGEQTVGFAPATSQRQDRGTFLADGGVFTWESYASKVGGPNLTVTGASTFQVGSGNLILSGVVAGDTLDVIAGPNVGTYIIASVDSTTTGTIEGTFPSSPDATNRLYTMGSGELSWTEIVSVFVPGVGKHTLAAGSVVSVHSSRGVFVDLDRESPAALTATARDVDDVDLLALDTRVMIGVRGEDNRFYLAGGTVLNDGDTIALGSYTSSISRADFFGDSRPVSSNYGLGGTLRDGTAIAVGGSGLVVIDATASYLSEIPNTGGVPDSDTYLEVPSISAFAQVASVDSNTQVTLATAIAPGPLGAHRFLNAVVGYIVGSNQLAIFYDHELMDEGPSGFYEEVGSAGATSYQVLVGMSIPPTSGITAINLAGAQGPQGPAGGQTLQEAYDAGGTGDGRSIAVVSGKPVEAYEDGTTGTVVVFQAGTSADKTLAQLRSDGQLTLQELRLADGSGDYWSLKGSGGNLVLAHEGTGQEIVFDDAGGMFARDSGAVPTGSTGDGVRVAEYAGTLTDEAVTTVATGIVGIKGVIFALADSDGDRWVGEMNLSSSTTRTVVVTFDATTGDITVSGSVAKTAEPGEEFQARDYTLLVFY